MKVSTRLCSSWQHYNIIFYFVVGSLVVWKSNGLAPAAMNRRDIFHSVSSALPSLVLANDQQETKIQPSISLDGIPFPLISFGLQIYDDETAYKLTMTALEVGYRNFFASVLARNQKGFAKAVRDSKVPRSDLFICGSVVSNRADGFGAARKSTTQGWLKNMEAFSTGNIDYLDQIMLDYPGPNSDSIRGQWKAFDEMADQKLTRTLSVSNFNAQQLDAILLDPNTKHKPLVNQLPYGVAYHPSIEYNTKRNVLVQAWAPLGGSLGGRFTSSMNARCSQIGAKYGKSGYQVALRWILQNGVAVCTQTKQRNHFVEDLNLFDFELTAEDMQQLGKMA